MEKKNYVENYFCRDCGTVIEVDIQKYIDGFNTLRGEHVPISQSVPDIAKSMQCPTCESTSRHIQVDKNMIPIVETLFEKGYDVISCCSGHYRLDQMDAYALDDETREMIDNRKDMLFYPYVIISTEGFDTCRIITYCNYILLPKFDIHISSINKSHLIIKLSTEYQKDKLSAGIFETYCNELYSLIKQFPTREELILSKISIYKSTNIEKLYKPGERLFDFIMKINDFHGYTSWNIKLINEFTGTYKISIYKEVAYIDNIDNLLLSVNVDIDDCEQILNVSPFIEVTDEYTDFCINSLIENAERL